MSYRCCKCKAVCSQVGNIGVFNTDEPCIYCGHTEYFWFDYYEKKVRTPRRPNVKVKEEVKKWGEGINMTKLTWEILDELFGGERVKYFQQADVINLEHYLRWEQQGEHFIISIGCSEGEFPFKLVSTKEEVEEIIRIMLK